MKLVIRMKILKNKLKTELNIRTEKDFPIKGIEFIDINPLIIQKDTFNEIINKGKNVHTLERLDKQMDIDTFWNEITIKENGQYKLMDRMKDFNINTYRELGTLLGYKDGTIFSTRLAHPEEAPIEFKTKLYNFFQDELNRQLSKEKTKSSKKKDKKIMKKIEEMENDFSPDFISFYDRRFTCITYHYFFSFLF